MLYAWVGDQKRAPLAKGERTTWMGPSKQFIEKWKRASAHVFFNAGPYIFYLAGQGVASRLGGPFRRREFALCALSRDEFLRAVRWEDSATPQ